MVSVRETPNKDYLALMRTPYLVDARRLYNPKEYESLNFPLLDSEPNRNDLQPRNGILQTCFLGGVKGLLEAVAGFLYPLSTKIYDWAWRSVVLSAQASRIKYSLHRSRSVPDRVARERSASYVTVIGF